ncbi:MAG TPA: response regulator [Candidatus Sulfotelmatobacter sp.]|nr:response regulator [Candidatus Sulfotelmatobacter sp.]
MARAKSRHRILLVNGYTTVQHLRALMLRMQGYHVDTAADLNGARTVIAASGAYDLVIVDVGHFADEGLVFCDEIKKKHADLKVLMQVDGHLYLDRESCPDKVVSKQEGPKHFVDEVDRLLQAS